MASQFSPAAATDDEDHQGTDADDCTSPTTSPTGPLLSPDTTLPSSLPNSSMTSKMTYNVTANSYSNGYSNTYSSGASTHHYLPPSNLSHTPSTINSPYTQHYTSLPPLPPVASLPATMSNVVMYSPNHAYTHGQPDYNHPLAGPAWSHIK